MPRTNQYLQDVDLQNQQILQQHRACQVNQPYQRGYPSRLEYPNLCVHLEYLPM